MPLHLCAQKVGSIYYILSLNQSTAVFMLHIRRTKTNCGTHSLSSLVIANCLNGKKPFHCCQLDRYRENTKPNSAVSATGKWCIVTRSFPAWWLCDIVDANWTLFHCVAEVHQMIASLSITKGTCQEIYHKHFFDTTRHARAQPLASSIAWEAHCAPLLPRDAHIIYQTCCATLSMCLFTLTSSV